jgi:hypothetical protein
MRPAREYLEAAKSVDGIKIIRNALDSENKSVLAHPLGRQALSKGFERSELLAVTHDFRARKKGFIRQIKRKLGRLFPIDS